MKLVFDSKDCSHDRKGRGMLIMAAAVIALFVMPLSIAVSPPPELASIRPALIAEAVCSAFLLLVLAIYLKGNGTIPGLPIRLYEEGVLMQPVLEAFPSTILYEDVSTIEFWFSGAGSGCSIRSRDGTRKRSVESFVNKEAFDGFIAAVSPTLGVAGFVAEANGTQGSAHITFRRKPVAPLSVV
jgi:hypothetical protein